MKGDLLFLVQLQLMSVLEWRFSCLYTILWTSGWILTKFSWIYNWDITKNCLDFHDLYLIFKVTAVEKMVAGHLFSLKTLLLILISPWNICCGYSLVTPWFHNMFSWRNIGKKNKILFDLKKKSTIWKALIRLHVCRLMWAIAVHICLQKHF